MANITRYNPLEDFFDVDAKDAKAEYKDGVLSLSLPKKSNGSAKRVAVS